MASSSDGTKLLAAQHDADWNGSPGRLYTSGDSGVSWAATSAPVAGWLPVASSSDGTRLLAAQSVDASHNPGQLFTSADSGGKWTSA